MANCLHLLSRCLLVMAFLMTGHAALAMGDRDELEISAKKHAEPIVQNPALANIRSRDMRVVDIKLLQMRPTAGVGAGSILPFSIRDVRDTIDPERRVAAASATTTPATSTSTTPTPTSTITCPDGTQFPTAGTFNSSIVFNLPSGSGACSLTAGPTTSGNSVFVVNAFTSVSATITGVNGWTVNLSSVAANFAIPAFTIIQVSKAGVTYRMTLDTRSALAFSGGNITISNFTRL